MGRRRYHPVEDTPEDTGKTTLTGIVCDCKLLNLRGEPKKDSSVKRVLPKGTMVEVDKTISTRYFYKVYTADGDVGFCMKQFISIRE